LNGNDADFVDMLCVNIGVQDKSTIKKPGGKSILQEADRVFKQPGVKSLAWAFLEGNSSYKPIARDETENAKLQEMLANKKIWMTSGEGCIHPLWLDILRMEYRKISYKQSTTTTSTS